MFDLSHIINIFLDILESHIRHEVVHPRRRKLKIVLIVNSKFLTALQFQLDLVALSSCSFIGHFFARSVLLIGLTRGGLRSCLQFNILFYILSTLFESAH